MGLALGNWRAVSAGDGGRRVDQSLATSATSGESRMHLGDIWSHRFAGDLLKNLLHYMSAGFAGRYVVGFEDLSIDVFLEVQY